MSLKLEQRQVGDITVINAKGKITIGSGDVQMRTIIKELLEKGVKKMVLNVGGVKYMDSSGVGELVSIYTSIANAGGSLYLTGISGKVLDLLQITQLLQVFETYSSVDEAIAEFNL